MNSSDKRERKLSQEASNEQFQKAYDLALKDYMERTTYMSMGELITKHLEEILGYVETLDKKEYCLDSKDCFRDDSDFPDNVRPESTTNPKDLIGAKKPRLSLVPSSAIIHMAQAMTNGADKYGPYNWRDMKVQSGIYIDAALRHIMSYFDGEEVAKDSGVKHLAHAMACIAIIIDAEENNCLIDTRPIKGKAADLIERLTKK